MKYKIFESEYHLQYIKWKSIHYDRKLCIEFINEYNHTKDGKLKKIYDEILENIGKEYIKKLLEGDYETCRFAEIEKYAREASIELLLNGQYSKETFKIISDLPLEDYKAVLKRAKEIYDFFSEIKIEGETKDSKIPGM